VDTLILVVQVLLWFLCPAIIGLILLQGGAGDISSAFGGGGQLDSTLGVGASKKMAKITGWLAGILFVFILLLAIPHKGSYGKAATIGGVSGAVPAQSMAPAPAAVPAPAATPAPAVVPATASSAPAAAAAPAPAATKPAQ
jgi:protein translocase SecG subunit